MDITCIESKFIERNVVIDAYLNSIKKFSVPTADEEVELFKKIKNGDNEARERLIMGHQRLIYSFAKQYAKNSSEVIDYVNEGNIGLAKAVETFDPSRGFKFMTYAQYYVRREMAYFLKTTNMVVEKSNYLKLEPKLKKIKSSYYNKYGVYPSVGTIQEILLNEYNIKIKNQSDLYDVMVDSSDIDKDDESFNPDFDISYNKITASYNDYEKDISYDHIKQNVNLLISKLNSKEKDIISMLFGIGEYSNEFSIDDVAYKYNISASNVISIRNKIFRKLKKYNQFKIAV